MSRAPSSEGLRSEAAARGAGVGARRQTGAARRPAPAPRRRAWRAAEPPARGGVRRGDLRAARRERGAPARSARRERRRARHGRRVPPDRRRARLGRAAAGRSRGRTRPGTRWRCWRATSGCPSAWARWPRWRRSPRVRAAATRCWRGRSTGWRSTTARSASAPPASSSRCSPTARRWPRSPIPSRCSTICRARSPPSPARRGRRSDRTRAGGCCSRCRGRWPAWRPACAPAIAAPPGWRKSAGTPRHPDVRGALSNDHPGPRRQVVRPGRRAGPGAARRARGQRQAAARSHPHPPRRRPRQIVAPDALTARR